MELRGELATVSVAVVAWEKADSDPDEDEGWGAAR
jgi:hypothetical protein